MCSHASLPLPHTRTSTTSTTPLASHTSTHFIYQSTRFLSRYLQIGRIPQTRIEALVSGVQFVARPVINEALVFNLSQAVNDINSSATSVNIADPCYTINDPALCNCDQQPHHGGESTLDVQQIVAAAMGGSVYAFRSGYWTGEWAASVSQGV